MRKQFGVAAVAAVVLGLSGVGSQAMPLAPVVSASDMPAMTLVADGCGPGGHRSHYGYCKPNGDDGFRGGPRYEGGPRFERERGYDRGDRFGEGYRRCFIRDTPYGPRRICR